MLERSVLALTVLTASVAACGPVIGGDPSVEASQVDGVWVFTYAEDPGFYMQALGGGEAAIVDGCLEVGGAVVVWHAQQLDQVEEVFALIEAGESPTVRVGGGGTSLDEGGSLDEFPDAVLEHCATTSLWWAGPEDLVIEE